MRRPDVSAMFERAMDRSPIATGVVLLTMSAAICAVIVGCVQLVRIVYDVDRVAGAALIGALAIWPLRLTWWAWRIVLTDDEKRGE